MTPDLRDEFNYLFEDSEVGKIAAEMDWMKHPLGPISEWSQVLKTSLSNAINSKFPMFISWGNGRNLLYNDAYIPILGNKHPMAFGKSFQETWSEVWPYIGTLISDVELGKSVFLENLRVPLNRFGYDEEANFTFSFGPIKSAVGVVEGISCVCVETTQQVQAKRQVEQAFGQAENARKELYEFFMQAPAPLVILLGPNHRYELVNPLYEKLIGGRQVIGKTVYEIFNEQEVGHFVELLDKVYYENKAYIGKEMFLEIPDENGELKQQYLNVVYHPFRNMDGTVKGILAFHHIVTDEVMARKKIEKLAEELKSTVLARDEFMSIASHELKTPLTSLKLQTQILKRLVEKNDLNEEKAMAFIHQTDKQVNRLSRLIDDMLDISRIRTGKLTIVKEEVHFCSIVRDVLKRMESQFTAAKYEVPEFHDCHDDLGEWDIARIEQVIMNLLTNAIRYGNGKTICLKTYSNSESVQLDVIDNGIGITSEDQQNIFNRFTQVKKDGALGGLGLGLFLSHQIIEAHQGTISVESKPGEGSTFSIKLPKRSLNRKAS